MFVNDCIGQYGHHWNVPGNYFGQQNPYMLGWNTMPHNIYGFGGQFPYFHNNDWTQNTGWFHGQTVPQTYITNPFTTGLQGGFHYNQQMTPFTNTYLGQGYTPFYGTFNSPFIGCR